VSHHHNAGQNQNIKIANKAPEVVINLKQLGRTLTNQNCIHEEIKKRLRLKNACYDLSGIFCLPIFYPRI
jgi:hypothetical protein